MANAFEPSAPSIEDIVLKAGELIKQSPDAVKVAWLGQRLNRELDTSIRLILGNRPLGDLLMEHFGDEFEIQGSGPHKEIGRKGSWKFRHPSIQYEQDFWKAFNEPISIENRRWINKANLCESREGVSQPAGDFVEIEHKFLIVQGQEVPNRAKFVRNNVQNWADQNSIDLKSVEVPVEDVATDVRKDHRTQVSSDFGMRAIRALLDAVPEDEREGFSISLKLLARLISY